MENVKEMEIQYCTSCGAANKKSAVICESCRNKIISRHRPVVDFIEKRAKAGAEGEITKKLYTIIRDFIFDHLYGIVLTVCVGAAITSSIVTATPYIENVTTPTYLGVEESETKEPGVTPEYAEWAEKHAIVVMSNYIDHSDYEVWAHNGYTISPGNISLDEIYAERAIPGFNYQGVHEMMTVRVPLGEYHGGKFNPRLNLTEKQGCVEGSYKFGENVVSSLGKTLYDEGYEVMECNYAISLYEKLDDAGTIGTTPIEKEEFRVLFVRNENNWYIAEETLVDRIKGDTYDLFMQYGPAYLD